MSGQTDPDSPGELVVRRYAELNLRSQLSLIQFTLLEKSSPFWVKHYFTLTDDLRVVI